MGPWPRQRAKLAARALVGVVFLSCPAFGMAGAVTATSLTTVARGSDFACSLRLAIFSDSEDARAHRIAMTIVSMTETATAAIAAPVLSISCGGSGRDSGGGGGGTGDHGNRIVHGVCTGVLQGWGVELHMRFGVRRLQTIIAAIVAAML